MVIKPVNLSVRVWTTESDLMPRFRTKLDDELEIAIDIRIFQITNILLDDNLYGAMTMDFRRKFLNERS